MTQAERNKNISRFITRWSAQNYKEDGNTAPFWIDLLEKILGVPHASDIIQFEDTFKHEEKGNPLYCDAWLPELRIMIEQKAPGVSLDAPYKRHGRTFQSAYEQAFEYDQTLPISRRSRYIIASNFHQIWIYDMDRPEAQREPVKIFLQDLAKDYKKLAAILDKNARLSEIVEVEVSVEAGEKVGRLYDTLLAEYKTKTTGDVTPQMLHALNVLCVRIVFCLYAEDAGLFAPDAFARYLESYRAENSRAALIDLFRVLDQKKETRDPFLPEKLAAFPYVNGGLFARQDIPIPPISEEIHNFLIHDMSRGFDWSKISPTIFGAVFESTLNPETRRKGGMHYTSVENIHKVIDPLFLDDLRAQVHALISATPEDKKYIKGRNAITLHADYERKLRALQDRLARLTFLDPACGSGNFLTETYLSLRRLENKIISELFGGDTGASALIDADTVRVKISQFHGIEINDFAVTVAKTALWIAESQMLRETEKLIHAPIDFLPLKTNANIKEGNALTEDWGNIVPKLELNYIIGNPPFVGYSLQSKEQKADILSVYTDENGKPYKTAGKIDFVAGWYFKAAQLMKGTAIRTAFVSTNSITQGEQVTNVWKPLYDRFGIHIDFAHRTFIWDSEANLKAHVHCVIVGFSCAINPNPKKIYEIDLSETENEKQKENNSSEKNNNITEKAKIKITEAETINPYLLPAAPIFVESRRTPLCDVPDMVYGSKPVDGGFLYLTPEEREEALKKEPQIDHFIKRIYGSEEYINNKERYCLWLVDASPSEIRNSPFIMARIEQVRRVRLNSPKAATRQSANTPTLFQQIRQPKFGNYILVPGVSSERRRYIPMGFLSSEIIMSDTCHMIPNATLYHFGILTSNVHMAWMRTVAGRLKSDYSYSSSIVYNNFPWPDPTDEQKQKIEQTAQSILAARARYPESTLADLYDPLTMPPDLRKAHRENDRATWEAYARKWDLTSEPACIAYLMQAYRRLTEK